MERCRLTTTMRSRLRAVVKRYLTLRQFEGLFEWIAVVYRLWTRCCKWWSVILSGNTSLKESPAYSEPPDRGSRCHFLSVST